MSRHYIDITVSAFTGQAVDIPALLRQLAKTHPALAAKLANVDLAALQPQLMTLAIQRAAERCKAQFSATFANHNAFGYTSSTSPVPAGKECVGVITNGMAELGVAMGADGSKCFFNNQQSSSRYKGVLDRWKEEVERCYREVVVETYMALQGLGSTTERVDGAAVVVAKDKKGIKT